MRRGLGAALPALAVFVAACGNSSAPGPGSVVSSYLSAVGVGNYANACRILDHSTRVSLETRSGRRTACAKVIARCLPNEATAFARDQTQQLYANVNLSFTNGSNVAVAVVSGTAVARTVKRVTLRQERGIWRLTSPGASVERCRR